MLFADLQLAEPILRALESEKYETATPIQAKAIPHVLEGKDVLGSAQTGTGKTAAFALPILHRLFTNPPQTNVTRRKPRVLVLAPTRELATQIATGFKTYGQNIRWLRYSVVFGGVSQQGQVASLSSGVDVIIACPGRLLDLINQGYCDLSNVDTLVLDEADRMLDMGFIHDIRRIISKLPGTTRQTLMFSATMPPEIRKLADTILRNPVSVAVAPVSQVADRIDESVYFVDKMRKPQLLAHLVKDLPMYRSIVFTRTKHGADKVVRKLEAFGIPAAAIHGNKSQNNRNRALHLFRENKIGVLVATDIAARGIDIDGVTHVVNFDLTHEPETYVHRIGRTARAGASGQAISFCDRDERENLVNIEKLIKRKIAPAALPEMPALPASERSRDHDADGRAEPRRYRDRAPHGDREGARHAKPARSFAADRQGERREGHRNDGHRNDGHRNDGHRTDRAPSQDRPHARPNASGGKLHRTGGGIVRQGQPRHHETHARPNIAPAGSQAGRRESASPTPRHAAHDGHQRPGAHGGHRPAAHGGHRPASSGGHRPAAQSGGRHPLHGGPRQASPAGHAGAKKPHRKGTARQPGRSHAHRPAHAR